MYFAIAVPSILCATIDKGQVWNERREGAENEIARWGERRLHDEEQGEVGESVVVEVQTRIDVCCLRRRLPNLSIRFLSLSLPQIRISHFFVVSKTGKVKIGTLYTQRPVV